MRSFAWCLIGLVAAGCGAVSNGRDDGGTDASCEIECAAPPPGCAYEGGDGCTTCGVLRCADAGSGCETPILCTPPPPGCAYEGGDGCTTCGVVRCADAGGGCETPIECAGPPVGCSYSGGDGCTTCGTLVCDEVVCGGVEARFPTFDRACALASDCAVVEHQINCCGTLVALGIRAGEEPRFDAAEARCREMFPGCGCPSSPTSADDGTVYDGSREARVECVAGQCTSTFGLADGDACGEGRACGAGLACCYPCGIPGCEFRCEPACDASDPGCAGGCIPRP